MKVTTFTVEGRGVFPFDMLRYDNCFPDTTEDAVHIGLTIQRAASTARQVFRISLRSHHNRIKGGEVTLDRWASFGWTVIESQTRTV